jgi:hypothetical protein
MPHRYALYQGAGLPLATLGAGRGTGPLSSSCVLSRRVRECQAGASAGSLSVVASRHSTALRREHIFGATPSPGVLQDDADARLVGYPHQVGQKTPRARSDISSFGDYLPNVGGYEGC